MSKDILDTPTLILTAYAGPKAQRRIQVNVISEVDLSWHFRSLAESEVIAIADALEHWLRKGVDAA
jgi:hypothetical protein